MLLQNNRNMDRYYKRRKEFVHIRQKLYVNKESVERSAQMLKSPSISAVDASAASPKFGSALQYQSPNVVTESILKRDPIAKDSEPGKKLLSLKQKRITQERMNKIYLKEFALPKLPSSSRSKAQNFIRQFASPLDLSRNYERS